MVTLSKKRKKGCISYCRPPIDPPLYCAHKCDCCRLCMSFSSDGAEEKKEENGKNNVTIK